MNEKITGKKFIMQETLDIALNKKCCDTCYYYSWYYDWCDKYKCITDDRAKCNSWRKEK